MATKAADPREKKKNHLKAMEHPLRRRIWELLVDGVASPKEMADALGEDLDDVSYHTRRLVELDCAEQVDEKKVRGAVKHFYRSTRKPLVEDEDYLQLLAEHPALAETERAVWMQAQLDAHAAAEKAGIFDLDDRFLICRTNVVLDKEGNDRLLAEIDRFELETLPEIVRQSAERRDKSGSDAVKVSVGFNIHKMP